MSRAAEFHCQTRSAFGSGGVRLAGSGDDAEHVPTPPGAAWYAAVASRGERFWLVRVPGLGTTEGGLPTLARRLADVEALARELIATYLDVPEDSFCVEVRVELPSDAAERVAMPAGAGRYRPAARLHAAERAERLAAERAELDWWAGQAARARSRSAATGSTG